MSEVKTLHKSFNGGEVAPEMYGMLDDAKVQHGCATLLNMTVRPQGPAMNRPGTEFVREVGDSSAAVRVIPFVFAVDQAMVIELGDGYMRFHTDGATLTQGAPAAYNAGTAYVPGDLVSSGGTNYYCIANTTGNAPPNVTYWYAEPATGEYEIPSPYAAADLFDLHFTQSNDVVTITSTAYQQRELQRLGATQWVLSTITFAPFSNPLNAATVEAIGTPGTEYFYRYAVTAVDVDGGENEVSELALQSTAWSVTAATAANPAVLTTGTVHGLKVGDSLYAYSFPGAYWSFLNGNYFEVDTVPSTTTFTLRWASDLNTGEVVDSSLFGVYGGGGQYKLAGIRNNLFTTGAANAITLSNVSGVTAVTSAVSFNVYKRVGGLYGFIGNTKSLKFIDDNIEADFSKTPPVYSDVFSGSGNYPAAVGYYDQRKVLAGTTTEPQRLVATRVGTESDVSYHLPLQDDDRIDFTIAARQLSSILHIVPLSDLLLLTNSTEFRVTSVNSDALTPTSFSVKPVSYIGASNVQPAVANSSVIYAAARGGHVQELQYAAGLVNGGSYSSKDISIRAPHLFDDYTVIDMAYAQAPIPVVWVVSSSGRLLGLTYVPEEQVGAWHVHTTDNGVFESCCVIPENGEDMLYVVVKRYIDGAYVRYIERMHSRSFAALEDCFFVDCGLTYDGAATSTITGLDHLEGETVNILADGAVQNQKTVSGGSITLDAEASLVHVGLPITAQLKPLPYVANIDGALAQGRPGNVVKVQLRVKNSSGFYAGPDEDNLRTYRVRTNETPGSPPAWQNGVVEIDVQGDWDNEGQVLVHHTDPTPLMITSMILTIEPGD